MKKNKIFTFLLLFFFFFLLFSSKNIYKNLDIYLNLSGQNNFYFYNLSLEKAKNKDFSQAKQLLPNSLENFENRRFELAGDILYSLSAPRNEIIEQYEQSLEKEYSSQVQEKINFLKEQNSQESDEKNSEEIKTEEEEKASNEVEKSRAENEKNQQNRQQYLNPYRANEASFQADMQHLQNILQQDYVEEQKDW